MSKLIPFTDNLCSRYAEKMISIKINNRCNCHCSFCVDRGGFNAGEINVDEIAKKTISFERYKTVIVTGGEPFMDFDSVVKLLTLIRPYKNRIVLNTNGTLLDGNNVSALNGLIDELQISVHHYNEDINASVFGRNVSFEKIKDALSNKDFHVSINSTFNKFTKEEERPFFVDNMIDLCLYFGADRLRLTELKKVDGDEFVNASDFFPNGSEVLAYKSNELITKGCTYYFDKREVTVSVKRLCRFAKGKDAPAFSCCFINTAGQNKIDVDTADTFKVIYSNGQVENDWIFDSRKL